MRRVLGGDILEMARKDCRECWGTGRLVVAAIGGQRREALCPCAQKAFAAVAPSRCLPAKEPGEWTWRTGCAPEEWGFTKAWWLSFIHGLAMRAFAEHATRRLP